MDENPSIIGVHEREIWWVSLGLNVGVETDGKHDDFERPVLVIKRFNREMLWILPVTSQIKSSLFHEKFVLQDKEYYAAVTQIRTVSTKRILRKAGMISIIDFKNIKERIISFLQMNEDPR